MIDIYSYISYINDTMWKLKLSKGAYRLILWLQDNYGEQGELKIGRDSWALQVMKDFDYTQPMVSMITKELLNAGVFKKTSFTIKFDLKAKSDNGN